MKKLIILLLILLTNQQGYSQQQISADAFKEVHVKKRKSGKICDTCRRVYFALNAEPDFSYVITGAGHTPPRFSSILRTIKARYRKKAFPSSSIHLISQRSIGISFLPNFLKEKGKRTQLYRNFGGEDYANLEFRAEQNGRIIKPWTPFYALDEDKEYAILGNKQLSDQNVLIPWKRTFHAGRFHLNIGDELTITVRNIHTQKIIKVILIIRQIDRATNFLYCQIPLNSDQLSVNLQDILNQSRGDKMWLYSTADSSGTTSVYEKDYGTIGLLRFYLMGESDELQYSFEKSPYRWQSAGPMEPQNAVYIVLRNDMPTGKTQNIYLRYKSQPETVHQVTIKVKEQPFRIPWGKIAAVSILLLAATGIGFYLWNKKNKRKLASLKRKNEDVETRLSLLSGQLNPHFLFNSLNAIQGTINSSNPAKANAYIGNVAGFMRDVMDNGRKEFVSLQEELKLEEDYLKLEQERMTFSYAITLAPEIMPSLIDFPPLLLQPVLENSIRHAFSMELPDPVITINISKNNTTLCVEVSDNGSAVWNTDGTREGHGLSLTRKRIAVYNEKLESMSIQMQINYQPGRGTVTTFTFQNWLA